jgi:hypothetical protein
VRGVDPHDAAVKVLADEILRAIAHEPAATVRKNVTIDWTIRKNVCAQLRVLGEAHLAQVRLPTGLGGAGDPDRHRVGEMRNIVTMTTVGCPLERSPAKTI